MEEEMKNKIERETERELDKFLMCALGYYDNDIWNNNGRYETTIFFWRSEYLHLDPIICNGMDKTCDGSDDSDIVITPVVTGTPAVIDIDVKVEPKNLSEKGMFIFFIHFQ